MMVTLKDVRDLGCLIKCDRGISLANKIGIYSSAVNLVKLNPHPLKITMRLGIYQRKSPINSRLLSLFLSRTYHHHTHAHTIHTLRSLSSTYIT